MNGHHSHGGYCRPLFAPVMDPWGEIPKWEPCGRCGGGMPPTLDPIYPDPPATDSISQSQTGAVTPADVDRISASVQAMNVNGTGTGEQINPY